MFKVDDVTAATTLPTPAAPGTQGFFTDGSPGTGVPATILRADFMNMVMMELINVVTAAGLTPSKTAYDQLLTAINSLAATPAATETVAGKAKIATQALTNAVTDDATFVTPKKIGSGFAISLGSSGYIALPAWLGGLIIQWIKGADDPADITEPTQTLTWPLAFPNAVLNVQLSIQIAAASITADVSYEFYGASTTGVSIQRQTQSGANNVVSTPFVLAIGH